MSAIGGLIFGVVMYYLIKSQFKSLFSKDSKSHLHREIDRKNLIIKMQKLQIDTLEEQLKKYKDLEKQTAKTATA